MNAPRTTVATACQDLSQGVSVQYAGLVTADAGHRAHRDRAASESGSGQCDAIRIILQGCCTLCYRSDALVTGPLRITDRGLMPRIEVVFGIETNSG